MRVRDLLEARKKGVTYTEVASKKNKAEQVVERVVAELSGATSGSWTKLSKKYIDLDDDLKKLQLDRDKLNAAIKEQAQDIFDTADEVLTRVIETAQLSITLSKKSQIPETKKVDYEAVVLSLTEAQLPEKLSKMIQELIDANTKIEPAKEVPEKLAVRRKKVDEAFGIQSIKDAFTKIVSRIKRALGIFDDEFSRLKKQVNAL
jgi:hypothetical protein